MKRLWLAAAVACLVTCPALAETPEAALLRRDFPKLVERIPLGEPADFAILVDVSGTMKDLWPVALTAVESFVASIPDGDYVSVIAFGTFARHLTTPVALGPTTRPALLESLKRLPAPKDQRTDLGLGVASLLDELNRPGGHPLKFAFVLTDFKHEPVRGSPFDRSFSPDDEPWRALAARRRNELAGKTVQASALLLPLEKDVGRDLRLVSAVFPDLRVEPITDPSALKSWFERRKAELLRDKLKARALRDLAEHRAVRAEALSVERVGLDGGGTLAVTLRGEERLLPAATFRTEKVAVEGDGWLHLVAVGAAEAGADAHQTTRVSVASFQTDDRPIFRTTRAATVRLTGTVVSVPAAADELRHLDLEPEHFGSAVDVRANVEIPVGFIPRWSAAVVALLLALAAAAVVRSRRPAYLTGRLAVVGGPSKRLEPREKARQFVVGPIPGSPQSGLAVAGARWSLELRACRSGDLPGLPRGTYARLAGASGRYSQRGRERPIGTGWVKVAPGTTFIIDATRIQWS